MLNPDYKIEKLSNGLTVVMEEVPYIRSVSVGFLVGAGSKNETKDNAGISHFIEHMQFKGTAKRTSLDIAQEMDAIGGRINAHTSKEYTKYYAVVLDTHTDIAIDVLSDMYLNSVYDKKELETERNVILEEINMYEDTPDELIHDLSTQYIWDGHMLGKPIIGDRKSVANIDRKKIIDYHKDFYTPDNTIIAIAGDIQVKEVMAQINDIFGGIKGKRDEHKEEFPHVIPGSKLVKKETEQVHVCLTCKGVSFEQEERFAVSLLSTLMGGSMSSRLFQKVREERGLVYSIYSYPSFYRNAGLYTTYAGTNLKNAQEVLDLIIEEYKDFKENPIDSAELTKAKEQLKGNMVLSMETTSSRMSWIAKSQYYYNEVRTLDEVFKKIDNVSAADLQQMANQLFSQVNMHLTAIGNFPKKNFFQGIEV